MPRWNKKKEKKRFFFNWAQCSFGYDSDFCLNRIGTGAKHFWGIWLVNSFKIIYLVTNPVKIGLTTSNIMKHN